MSRTFVQTANQIIAGAHRICGTLAEKQALELDDFNDGLDALNVLMNSMAEQDEGLWRMSWGTQTFTASSPVSDTGKYYRCIRGHTSSASTRPGTGGDWESYWYEDSSVSATAVAWATATAYTCAGDFTYTNASAVAKAFLRYNGTDYPVKLSEFGEFLNEQTKWEEGQPDLLYFDRLNSYKVYLHPLPDSDVVSNAVLHLLTIDNIAEVTTGGDAVPIPPTWVRAMKYLLASDIADEKGLSIERIQYLNSKAQALWAQCRRGPHSDVSEVKGIKPCF